MNITKEQVLQALEGVLFFPKGENIVALKMVTDLKVEGKKISFSIVFPKAVDKSNDIVIETSKKTLLEKVSKDAEIEIRVKSPKDTGEGALSEVKHIIAVASGKGGVGKSTVAVNLAIALSKTGAKVGILDTDIYGPSIPIMFGLESEKPNAIEVNGETKIQPIEKYNLKILSIGFFVDPEQALVWRGPMASKALQQLLNDTQWGELDYLVLDLPPGTGDIQLTLAQEFKIDGVVVVTTPQKVALADVQKAATMFRQEKIYIPILGLVENMAYFTPEELPDNKYYIFGKSYSKSFAKRLNIPFLEQIPIVQGIAESGDAGKPFATDANNIVSKVFDSLADKVIKGINTISS
jgi:ATP-binding protein involved in chromosome partitioning